MGSVAALASNHAFESGRAAQRTRWGCAKTPSKAAIASADSVVNALYRHRVLTLNAMARYKPVDRHLRFLPVVLLEQIQPGTFAFALDHLVDHELGSSACVGVG
jgi:hypothetical protein